jgi:hypothetical protein
VADAALRLASVRAMSALASSSFLKGCFGRFQLATGQCFKIQVEPVKAGFDAGHDGRIQTFMLQQVGGDHPADRLLPAVDFLFQEVVQRAFGRLQSLQAGFMLLLVLPQLRLFVL